VDYDGPQKAEQSKRDDQLCKKSQNTTKTQDYRIKALERGSKGKETNKPGDTAHS